MALSNSTNPGNVGNGASHPSTLGGDESNAPGPVIREANRTTAFGTLVGILGCYCGFGLIDIPRRQLFTRLSRYSHLFERFRIFGYSD
jgi:hypothetical protein